MTCVCYVHGACSVRIIPQTACYKEFVTCFAHLEKCYVKKEKKILDKYGIGIEQSRDMLHKACVSRAGIKV